MMVDRREEEECGLRTAPFSGNFAGKWIDSIRVGKMAVLDKERRKESVLELLVRGVRR